MSQEGVSDYEGVIWTTVEPTVVESTGKHRFTIVLCHGRGSTGPTFREEIFESTSTKGLSIRDHFPSVKWVFPSAGLPFDPRESVQDEAQWFVVSSLKDPDYEQVRQRYGISESIKHLHRILDKELGQIRGKASRVILGGISQGCAVAIRALLASQHRLNSFVGFCSWLPFSDLVASASNGSQPVQTRLWNSYGQVFQVETGSWESVGAARSNPVAVLDFLPVLTPCFLSHNANDDVVNVKLGRSLRDELKALGMRVTWDEHEHGDEELKHWIHEPKGMDNLIRFLEDRMGLCKDSE